MVAFIVSIIVGFTALIIACCVHAAYHPSMEDDWT